VSRYKVDRKQVISHGAESLKMVTGALCPPKRSEGGVAVKAITNLSWVQELIAKTMTSPLIIPSVLGFVALFLISSSNPFFLV